MVALLPTPRGPSACFAPPPGEAPGSGPAPGVSFCFVTVFWMKWCVFPPSCKTVYSLIMLPEGHPRNAVIWGVEHEGPRHQFDAAVVEHVRRLDDNKVRRHVGEDPGREVIA